MAQAGFHLTARTGHPDFLDLPWDEPLEEWQSERLVKLIRDIGPHVVRFVEYEARSTRSRSCRRGRSGASGRYCGGSSAKGLPVVEAVGTSLWDEVTREETFGADERHARWRRAPVPVVGRTAPLRLAALAVREAGGPAGRGRAVEP